MTDYQVPPGVAADHFFKGLDVAKDSDRIRVDEVDWVALLPWLRLFRSFRMAIQPAKIVLALLLVLLVYLGGKAIDSVSTTQIRSDAIERYASSSGQSGYGYESEGQSGTFDSDRSSLALEKLLKRNAVGDEAIQAIVKSSDRFEQAKLAVHKHYVYLYDLNVKERDASQEVTAVSDDEFSRGLAQLRVQRAIELRAIDSLAPEGVFAVLLDYEVKAFGRLVDHVVSLEFFSSERTGEVFHDASALRAMELHGVAPTPVQAGAGAVGAGRDMFVVGPSWVWKYHRWHFIVFAVWLLVVASLFGGALARMTSLHAAREQRIGVAAALISASKRWWVYFVTPLAPLCLVALFFLLLCVGGLVFFNPQVWGVDLLGSVLFGLALAGGAIVGFTFLLTAVGGHLFYAAIAVEGADCFDAVSRVVHYVINRLWQWLFFNVVAVVFGAVTYLLISCLVFVVLWVVHVAVGMWVYVETDLGMSRLEVLFPEPRFGQLSYDVDYTGLEGSAVCAAWIIRCWVFVAAGVLAAYAVSYYYTANTWIFLLLRKSADDVAMTEVFVDAATPNHEPPNATPDEVDANTSEEPSEKG